MTKFKTLQSATVHRKAGADPFGDAGWRGIDTETNPGSLPPNVPQWVEGMRIKGRDLITRGGLTLKIDLDDYSARSVGAVMGLLGPGKGQDDLRNRLWAASLGCTSAAATGFEINQVDTANTPLIMRYVDARAVSDRFAPIGRYGDRMFVGDAALLREVQQITPPKGVNITTLMTAGAQPLIEVRAFTGYSIRSMIEHDGTFFISLENDAAAANSKIVAYNGTSFRDDITGIRPALAFGKWQNKLVAGFDATAGHIRVREAGSSVPGTWTTYALGGFQCSFNQNSIQECRDKTYIASGATQLYAFNGTALSLVNTVATADAGGDGVSALCLYDGLLHYGWNTTVTLASHIGRHDPDSTATEFIDNYLDITLQQANFKRLGSLQTYRRRIYAGGAGGSTVWLVRTATNDVKGTVDVVSGASASAGFRTRQLLRFP